MTKRDESLNQKALKAGAWYTVSNFMVRGISFITTPLFTRILSQADYGSYSNYASWLSLLTILTTFDLYTSISRAKFDYRESLDQYVFSIQTLGTLITAVCFAVVHMFPDFFVSFFGMDMLYINIIFIYLLVAPSFTLLQTKHRQQMKYKAVTAITFTSTIATALVSVVLVLCMENGFLARVIGNTVVMFALCLVTYFYNIFRGHSVNIAHWKYAIMISLPLIPHVLAGNILSSSDRIMITRYCGSESTALYSVIYSCSQIVMLLLNSVNQAWSPWFYEQLSRGNSAIIKKTYRIYIVCAAYVVTVIMLAAPEVVLFFGGSRYAESTSIMPPIMLGCFYWCLYTFFVNTEIYYKKTFTISVLTLSAAATNLLLNYVFIRSIGWQAAAYTTLFGYFMLLVLHSFRGKKLGTDEYFSRKFIFAVAGVMFLIMLLVRVLYSYFVIRVIILACMAMVLFIVAAIHRDKIISVIKKK